MKLNNVEELNQVDLKSLALMRDFKSMDEELRDIQPESGLPNRATNKVITIAMN